MARRPQPKPWARIGFIAAVLVAMFATILAGGYKPRLALDLAGGTTVTLEPRECAGGTAPSSDLLSKARDIIERRVNGLGVSEAEVFVQGKYIVVSVPNSSRADVLKSIGSTAQLRFRKVLSTGFYSLDQVNKAIASQSAAAASNTPSPSDTSSVSTSASGTASAVPSTSSSSVTVSVAPGATANPGSASASASSSAKGDVISGALGAGTPTTSASTAATTPVVAPTTAPVAVAVGTATTSPTSSISSAPATNACTQDEANAAATPSASTSVVPSASGVVPSGSAAVPSGSATPSAAGRVLTGALAAGTPTPTTAPTTAAAASPSASAAASPLPSPTDSAAAAPVELPITDGATVDTACADATAAAATDPNTAAQCQTAFATYQTLDCSTQAGQDTIQAFLATDYAVGCSDNAANSQEARYFLAPAAVEGTDVSSATSGPTQTTTGTTTINTGGYEVDLTFKNDKFSDFTAANVGSQFAIVLDGAVESAPTIQTAIVGSASITGSFTATSAAELATTLKFGALPLTFDDNAQTETISPTLGKQQLQAGLLAGGIGLFLVLIYSFIYYRAMGIITVVSLSVSGGLVYGSIVLLGQAIGFTLSLSGIAGFIVAIGITADSFVVYYERIKDELKEGRTARSSVDRAWVAARRTILSADTVSLLAAVVLYYTTVGTVRGFAFTLGLSTLLDIVVVFLFTKPVIGIAIQYKTFSTSKNSGLHIKPQASSRRPGKPLEV